MMFRSLEKLTWEEALKSYNMYNALLWIQGQIESMERNPYNASNLQGPK